MTYRNDLDAAHARIDVLERENRARLDAAHARIAVLERENRALETELARLRAPAADASRDTEPVASISARLVGPMCMQPVRRAPIDVGDLLGAARIVIFLFIVLSALVLDVAR